MTQTKMETVECNSSFVEQRLREDGLLGLCPILHSHHAYIAGSYVIPWYEPINGGSIPDIDIWVPFNQNQPQTREDVMAITTFLYTNGYRLPKYSYSSSGRPSSEEYGRIQYMIKDIICFKGIEKTQRNVQIMVMKEAGGDTPEDIIRHFDLTIVQRYFDGICLRSTHLSLLNAESRLLTVNISSEVIQNQSFREWIRTLARLHKYSTRGYTLSPEVLQTLLTYIPASVAKSVRIMTVYKSNLKRSVQIINIEKTIHEWNNIAQRIDWTSSTPIVTLTVKPPGVFLHDLHICIVCTPSVLPISWSLVPTTQCRRILATTVVDIRRTLYWDDADHLLSTLAPFPGVHQVNATDFVSCVQDIVHDHILLEDRTVQEYLDEDPLNHFIVYGPNDRACTISREQVRNAKVYLPCRTKNSSCHLEVHVMHKACLTINTMYGTYYVPCIQMDDILLLPGTRRFQLVPTGIHWDCSTILLHTPADREDAQSYVGGITNNGGPWSHKYIHFIRRLP